MRHTQKLTGVSRERSELTKGLTKEAEEAAQKGEQKNVYKISKLISGKYSGNRSVPIRDKQEGLNGVVTLTVNG